MLIVKKHYPNKDYVFIFDNATIHTKLPESTPNVNKMMLGPLQKVGGEEERASSEKVKISYAPAILPDRTTQQLYHPLDHPNKKLQGTFKVCPIGNTPAILGMTWLTAEVPLIDWQQGSITFPKQIQITSKEEADLDPLSDLPHQYHKFSRVFGEEEFKVLPPHREYHIAIDPLPNAKLSPGPIYGMMDAESKALQQHTEEELATGKIRPSTSSAGAPVMLVKKADGSLQLAVDYTLSSKSIAGQERSKVYLHC
ncbi:Retrotransposable element Tf2 protein [Rhizoctonia solani]|uniref:Retrotransposable element Tf2 protein n=1 Tax=Rhizoctonia solani TaxID=456999 RepID=A0A8H8P6D3_9AGAM|nr:Retrotransposable element Tf2 protein [Rhizoctonia solani]QRW24392.1 Retrotransposable element Tf2 protein [Rhizoctonia solani]